MSRRLVGVATNMHVGVTGAGYTVAQELPIFVIVFVVTGGSYQLNISAVNDCGTSAPTAVQTVVVA